MKKPQAKADQKLHEGDVCVVIRIPGRYCKGFGPGTIVTLKAFEIFYFDLRWRCTNQGGETAWATPNCLRKLPPDQWQGCDFDWRELCSPREVAA